MRTNFNSSDDVLIILKGENGSSTPCVFADLPTDPIKVINNIREQFIKDENFRTFFVESISLLSNDEEYSWLSLYYLFSILRVIKTNKLIIDINCLILNIEDGIKKNEIGLRNTFEWSGKLYKNGLWGDVEVI